MPICCEDREQFLVLCCVTFTLSFGLDHHNVMFYKLARWPSQVRGISFIMSNMSMKED
jgi:hypothetical protein